VMAGGIVRMDQEEKSSLSSSKSLFFFH
jgi:hypothetical protein